MLTPLQQDALQEYMNIFTGQAAGLLSELVNKRVNLTITELKLLHVKEENGAEIAKEDLPFPFQGNIVSSSIRFGQSFSGHASLIFPLETTKELVRLCLEQGNDDPALEAQDKLTDTDYDAVREVGNIILNAVVGGFGNLMELQLQYDLPEVEVFASFDPVKDLKTAGQERFFLVFFKTFSVHDTSLTGAIIVVLSLESINMVLEKIDEVLIDVDR